MRFSRLALISSAIVLVAASVPASAAPVRFNDRAAWTAAAQDITTVTFEGIAPVGGFEFFVNGPVDIGGVEFATIPNTGLFVVDPDFGPAFYDWGSGAVLNFDSSGPLAVLTATLPAGMSAVGFDVMTFQMLPPYASTVNVEVNDGGTTSFTVHTDELPFRTFFGVIAASPITSITISGITLGINVDNFSYGKAREGPPPHIPEPSTVILLGFGLVRLRARVTSRRK